MHNQELCTEEYATKLAGVSARTLHRFCESGYLTVTNEADGSRRYLVQQLSEIFGIHGSTDSVDDSTDSMGETPQTEGPNPLTAIYGDGHESQQVSPPSDDISRAQSIGDQGPLGDTDSAYSAKNIGLLELEIERLKNLLSIQERILDSKDDEIADLRNQRAWLRERVEKFEEKSDRDQILLLSETQTIRSLLAYQEARKSTLRQLLEWVGLAQSPQLPALAQSTDQKSKGSTSSRTIEVKRTANSD